ncbi:MAG: hypothetical protein JNJ85_03770 [Candidatus Kapabacteria bacterium]|nr:hypothetical protein [Candidatus Kapabacteria bacterium]
MEISNDTQAVIEYLDNYSGNNLRKKNDMATIFELAATKDSAEIINTIVFSGTSLWKVFGVLRKQTPQSEGYKQLENEFAASMNELRSNLSVLVEETEEEILQRFHDIYLSMNSGVIRNLTDLAHDLSQFKELQNEMKRNG